MRDFEAVLALDRAAQEALLRAGDPPARLWAAWAIALRDPHLQSIAIEGEPSEGVRAGLCTILAGRGEIETLRVLSAEDPSSLVRGQACRYLCRIAPVGPWLDARLADRAATVRAITILEMPEASRARDHLADADESVRAAAIERLESDPSAKEWFLARVMVEPSLSLRDRIIVALFVWGASELLLAEKSLVEPIVELERAGKVRLGLAHLLDIALDDELPWRVTERATVRALSWSSPLSAAEADRVRTMVARLSGWIEDVLAEDPDDDDGSAALYSERRDTFAALLQLF